MDYSEVAFGAGYQERQAEAGRNLTPEERAAALQKAQATFGAIGIDVGSITKGLNLPQQGFTDPRQASDLLTAPAFPKTREDNKDGSGVNTVNQPAQRNPLITGFPSVSPLAINDAKLAPSQVTEKLKSLITNISGPKAGSINVDIAGGAAGPATLLNGGDLTSKLSSLLPSAGGLSGSIVHLGGAFGATSAQQGQAAADFATAQSTIGQGISQISLGTNAKFNSALDSLTSLPSKLTGGTITSLSPDALTSQVSSGISGALSKITPAQMAQADADFAKAQATIAQAFGNANGAAANMQQKAQDSLANKLNLGNLRSGAGNIADNIFNKLKAFAPANISTKIPVAGLDAPGYKFPIAQTGVSTMSDPVPNPIPANVPLYKAESTQTKAEENCVSTYSEYLKASSTEFISKVKNATDVNQILTLQAEKQNLFSEWDAQKSKVISGISNFTPGKSDIITNLNSEKLDYTNKVNNALNGQTDLIRVSSSYTSGTSNPK